MRALWWFPRVFAGIGLLLLVIGTYVYSREQAFITGATRTEGRIVRMQESHDDDGTTYRPVFEFTDARGQTYTGVSRVGTSHPSRKIGDAVPVLYDPANPDEARIASYFQLHIGSFVLSLLALVFGGVGFVWLYLVRRREAMIEELRLSGARVKAKVIGIHQRTNITVNNRHPWRIEAEAQEASRAGQIYYSGNIWSDPREKVPETVEVWVDRNDPRRHHIELGFIENVTEQTARGR